MNSNKYTRLEVYRIVFGYYIKHVLSHLLVIWFDVLRFEFWKTRLYASAFCWTLFLTMTITAVAWNKFGWVALWGILAWISSYFLLANERETQQLILKLYTKLLEWHPGGYDPKAK